MDSMRVVTNLLGNCVAAFAVSRWEGALDLGQAKKVLNGEAAFVPNPDHPTTSPEPAARPESVRPAEEPQH